MANLQIKCPNCSGSVVFDPEKNKMVCQFCDSIFEVNDKRLEDNQELIHKSTITSDENLLDGEKPEEYWKKIEAETRGFSCPSCGGTIIGTSNSSSLFCPYCGNPSIIEGNLEGTFRPDFIIPYEKTRDDAIKGFEKFCGKGIFMPSAFKPDYVVEKVTGLYVPYHLYSCTAGGNATYDCEIITRWEDRDFVYRKVDTYISKRAGFESFTNVPADASKSVDDDYMESIEPYNYKNLVPFDMKYLSGYLSDKYDVAKDDVLGIIKNRVSNTLFSHLQSTVVGYDHVFTRDSRCEISEGSFSYALLPVWLLRAKYNKKYYYFAMNGETGKCAGKMPISVPKVLLFGLAVAILAGVLCYFISGNEISWGIGVGLIAGLISGLIAGTRYKNVAHKKFAYEYVSTPLKLTHKADMFIKTHTSRTRKNNERK